VTRGPDNLKVQHLRCALPRPAGVTAGGLSSQILCKTFLHVKQINLSIKLFVYLCLFKVLFNDINGLGYHSVQRTKWLVNNKLGSLWNVAVAAKFQALSRHFPGGLRRTAQSCIQCSRAQNWDLNLELSEYEVILKSVTIALYVQNYKLH